MGIVTLGLETLSYEELLKVPFFEGLFNKLSCLALNAAAANLPFISLSYFSLISFSIPNILPGIADV